MCGVYHHVWTVCFNTAYFGQIIMIHFPIIFQGVCRFLYFLYQDLWCQPFLKSQALSQCHWIWLHCHGPFYNVCNYKYVYPHLISILLKYLTLQFWPCGSKNTLTVGKPFFILFSWVYKLQSIITSIFQKFTSFYRFTNIFRSFLGLFEC